MARQKQIHPDNQPQYFLPKWLKENLMDRALKRKNDITTSSDGTYVCSGNPNLGDHFPLYEVAFDAIDNRWKCSCQNHVGGCYRGQCSHIAATLIFRAFPNWRVLSSEEVEAFYRDQTARKNTRAESLFETSMPEEVFWNLQDELDEQRTSLHEDNAVIDEQDEEQAAKEYADSIGNTLKALQLSLGLIKRNEATEFVTHQAENTQEIIETQGGKWIGNDKSGFIEYTEKPQTLVEKLIQFIPSWCDTIRENQIDALEKLQAAIESGKRNILFEGPVGMGKTLVAYLIAKLNNCRANYICTTHTLQEQAKKDFNDSELLKGRANYPTADYALDFPETSCKDCTYKKQYGCKYCEPQIGSEGQVLGFTSKLKCPYYKQKKLTQKSPLAILNTTYALTVFSNLYAAGTDNIKGTLGYQELKSEDGEIKDSYGFARRGMSIYDEADELESTIAAFIEVEITPYICRLFRLTTPTKHTRWEKRIEWMKSLVQKITDYETRISTDLFSQPMSESVTQNSEPTPPPDPEFEDKQLAQMIDLRSKLEFVISSIDPKNTDERRETWVYERIDEDRCKFKPVRINEFAESALFSNSHINFIMSGTIIAPEQFAQDLGLKQEETAFVSIPSPFDPVRRPFIFRNCGSMSYKNRDASIPRVISEIKKIRETYPGRMLVHTVSYKLTNELYSALTRFGFDVFKYDSAAERKDAIENYLCVENSILLAPSLQRGFDFKHEKCRLNIIPQMPYPNPTDPVMSRKMYQPTPREGALRYKLDTIRTVIQAYGRGMRSTDDWCRTFCLDEQFKKLWFEVKSMLPDWFIKAVRFDTRDDLSILIPSSATAPMLSQFSSAKDELDLDKMFGRQEDRNEFEDIEF